jgi:hypothetical protein
MLPVSFIARPKPLQPVAVAALGEHARALAAKLLQFSDAQLRRFAGVAAEGATVILGPSDALPWFDGALYLGAQGPLLMPTWAQPTVHPHLLERALRSALPAASSGPLALLFSTVSAAPRVVPLEQARPLSRGYL